MTADLISYMKIKYSFCLIIWYAAGQKSKKSFFPYQQFYLKRQV
jgi:hypothetical protein